MLYRDAVVCDLFGSLQVFIDFLKRLMVFNSVIFSMVCKSVHRSLKLSGLLLFVVCYGLDVMFQVLEGKSNLIRLLLHCAIDLSYGVCNYFCSHPG